MGSEDGDGLKSAWRRANASVAKATKFVGKSSAPVKAGVGVLAIAAFLAVIWLIALKDQDIIFILAEVCSVVMESDVHTVLDLLTLAATAWVVYTMRRQLRATYGSDTDTLNHWLVLLPCVGLAMVAHPGTAHTWALRCLWAACVYLEAVSVLPQLVMMRNCKVVEPFTAAFVFCLGAARALNCGHWVLQLLSGQSFVLSAFKAMSFARPLSAAWPLMVLVSEAVQTFILADFCYYYLASFGAGRGGGTVHLPAGVV